MAVSVLPAKNSTIEICFDSVLSFHFNVSQEPPGQITESLATNYYALLSIPNDAPLIHIKHAYHRALLHHHPDKQVKLSGDTTVSDPNIISLLKEAFLTLSNPESRVLYDAQLRNDHPTRPGPRPAQVVSLEDFELDADLSDVRDEEEDGPWRHPCRCGGWYRISTDLMENGKHLIGCSSCSEVIWCGYEQVEEDGV